MAVLDESVGMVPLKWLQLVFCLGAGVTCRTRAEMCRDCPSFDSCRYRLPGSPD